MLDLKYSVRFGLSRENYGRVSRVFGFHVGNLSSEFFLDLEEFVILLAINQIVMMAQLEIRLELHVFSDILFEIIRV